jgi:hypothetical protein
MKESKVTTYLLYAIGEIILVVIGILIAVQIDDWNQQRVNKITLNTLLLNLKAEQEFNISYLQRSKSELDKSANCGFRILRVIGEKRILDERTTDSLIYSIISTKSTSVSQSAVIDIISSEKIELIKNDSLRYLLLAFGSKIEDLKEQQRLNNGVLNTLTLPYLYNYYAFTKMDSRF